MSDDATIIVEVEADESQAVNATRGLAQSMLAAIDTVAVFEEQLEHAFGISVRTKIEAITAAIDAVTVATIEAQAVGAFQGGNLPDPIPFQERNRRVRETSRQLASGGAQTEVEVAAQRGLIKRTLNDPALDTLAEERAQARVRAARRALYDRKAQEAEDAGLEGNAPGKVNATYVQARRSAGDQRDGQVILDEAKQFEAERVAAAETSAAKIVAIQEKATADYERIDARAFDAQETRRKKAEDAAAKRAQGKLDSDTRAFADYDRLDARAMDAQLLRQQKNAEAADRRNQAKIDSDAKAFADYDRLDARAMDRQITRDKARAEAEARRSASAAAGGAPARSDEEIAARSLSIQRARQTTGGGLPFLQTQIGSLAGFAAIGGLIGGVTAAGRATIDFQAKLQELQAVARATDPEMKVLSTAILEVGSNSKFSVKDLGETAIAIAQAGFSATEVAKILPSVNALAAATGSSLKDSAALTTSILSIYSLGTERTASVVNTLAAAANTSKLTLAQVQTAIQYAGATAAASGVQFDQLTTSFSLMANAGVRSGSLMGTGTRMLIAELANPTAKFKKELDLLGISLESVDIKTQGYLGALQNLKSKGFDVDVALRAFDRRAEAAYAAQYKGLDNADQITLANTGTNAAFEASKTQMQSLQAQTQRLGNGFIEFVNVAGTPFISTLTGMASALTGLLHAASEAAPALVVLGTVLGALAAANVLVWLGGLVAGIYAGIAASAEFTVATLAAAAATEGWAFAIGALTLSMLSNPVVLLTVGITALVAVMFGASIATGLARQQLEQFQSEARQAGDEVKKYKDRIGELDATIQSLTDRHARLSRSTTEVGNETALAQKKFQSFGGTLDGIGGNVDNLISKLQHLKNVQKDALGLAAVVQVQADQKALTQAKAVRDSVAGGSANDAKLLLGRLSNRDRQALGTEGVAALQTLTNGDLNGSQLLSAIGTLQNLQGGVRDSRNGLSNLLDSAGVRGSAQLEVDSSQTNLQNDQGFAATYKQQNTPAYKNYQAELNAAAVARAERNRQLGDFKGSAADKRALAAQNERTDAAEWTRLRNEGSKIPGTAELQNSQVLNDLEIGGGGARGPQGSGSPASQLRDAEAHYALSKARGDIDGMKAAMGKIESLHSQGIKSSGDAANDIGSADNLNDADETRLEKDIEAVQKRGARRGANNQARFFKDESGVLKDQIEELAGQTNPDNLSPNIGKLGDLLGQYDAAGRSEVTAKSKAQGETPAQLAEALAKWDADTKKFAAKTLQMTLSDASQVLADQASRAAATGASTAANQLRTGQGNLNQAMDATIAKMNEALQQALLASDEKFAAEGKSSSSDALKARVKITEDYQKKTIEHTLELIDAALKGDELRQQSERYQFDANQAARRRQQTLGASPLGQRTVGDTHRAFNDINARAIDIDDRRFDVNQLQDQLTSQTTARDALLQQQSVYAPGTENFNGFNDKILAANQALEKTNQELRLAKQSLDGLTVPAERFKNASQAIGAAWKVYADQAGLNKPLTEKFADGMVGVFQQTENGFSNLVKNVLTGTKSMKDALKEFALSVVSAMLDMIAKLLAQEAMKAIFGLFGSILGGGSTGGAILGNWASVPGFTGAQTGKVIRRAGGGGISGRDSVNTLLMPGEGVLNQAAMSMVTEDGLNQMNGRGNVAMGGVQSAARDNKREPDVVNVYAMAPGQQPSLGPNDVLHIISSDVLSGGQTKQLIKAVMVGAA